MMLSVRSAYSSRSITLFDGRVVCGTRMMQSTVVQEWALQGGWNERKLIGYDNLSGMGDTRVNNCTVFIFNYLILFS